MTIKLNGTTAGFAVVGAGMGAVVNGRRAVVQSRANSADGKAKLRDVAKGVGKGALIGGAIGGTAGSFEAVQKLVPTQLSERLGGGRHAAEEHVKTKSDFGLGDPPGDLVKHTGPTSSQPEPVVIAEPPLDTADLAPEPADTAPFKADPDVADTLPDTSLPPEPPTVGPPAERTIAGNLKRTVSAVGETADFTTAGIAEGLVQGGQDARVGAGVVARGIFRGARGTALRLTGAVAAVAEAAERRKNGPDDDEGSAV